MIALVADVLGFQRGLAPFIEHSAQVQNGKAWICDHLVGPTLIKRAQRVGFLADCHISPPRDRFVLQIPRSPGRYPTRHTLVVRPSTSFSILESVEVACIGYSCSIHFMFLLPGRGARPSASENLGDQSGPVATESRLDAHQPRSRVPIPWKNTFFSMQASASSCCRPWFQPEEFARQNN